MCSAVTRSHALPLASRPHPTSLRTLAHLCVYLSFYVSIESCTEADCAYKQPQAGARSVIIRVDNGMLQRESRGNCRGILRTTHRCICFHLIMRLQSIQCSRFLNRARLQVSRDFAAILQQSMQRIVCKQSQHYRNCGKTIFLRKKKNQQ